MQPYLPAASRYLSLWSEGRHSFHAARVFDFSIKERSAGWWFWTKWDVVRRPTTLFSFTTGRLRMLNCIMIDAAYNTRSSGFTVVANASLPQIKFFSAHTMRKHPFGVSRSVIKIASWFHLHESPHKESVDAAFLPRPIGWFARALTMARLPAPRLFGLRMNKPFSLFDHTTSSADFKRTWYVMQSALHSLEILWTAFEVPGCGIT